MTHQPQAEKEKKKKTKNHNLSADGKQRKKAWLAGSCVAVCGGRSPEPGPLTDHTFSTGQAMLTPLSCPRLPEHW